MSDADDRLQELLALWNTVRQAEPPPFFPASPPLDVDPASATEEELTAALERQRAHRMNQPCWLPYVGLHARSERPVTPVRRGPSSAEGVVVKQECPADAHGILHGLEIWQARNAIEIPSRLLEASLKMRVALATAVGIDPVRSVEISDRFGPTVFSWAVFVALAALELPLWKSESELVYGCPLKTIRATEFLASTEEVAQHIGSRRLEERNAPLLASLFGGGEAGGRSHVGGTLRPFNPPLPPFLLTDPWHCSIGFCASLAELSTDVLRHVAGTSERPPVLLLQKEVATRLGVSERGVRRLADAKRLERSGAGRITERSVRAFEAQCTLSASPDQKRTKRTK